jgi:hypothetical protein
VPERQLDDADVQAVHQQPASPFVTQVVPVPIDLLERRGMLDTALPHN